MKKYQIKENQIKYFT